MSHNYVNTTFTKWYIDICGRELLCNREFQDGNYKARVPREERPAHSHRQGPHRRGEEGEGEGQDCKMEEEEPEGTVSIAALPTLERCVCVQEATKLKVVALLPPPRRRRQPKKQTIDDDV